MSNSIYEQELSHYYTVWHAYNYVYSEWAKEHGLSVNGLLFLCAIHDNNGSCTQKMISSQWMIPKQTVNMVLKDFESKGFVEQTPMPEDKRNKLIRFTESGEAYAESIVSELRKAEIYATKKIGVERMRQLSDTLSSFMELFREAENSHENNG